MNEVLFIFQSFRRILCVCPHCGSIFRLSDMTLAWKGKGFKTWLDEYESNVLKLQDKIGKFEEKEQSIRDEAAERGRKKAEKHICKLMCSELAKLKYNPYDIKAIWHPVDYVVFNGMNNKDEVDDVTFLSRKINDANLNKIRKTVKECVEHKKFEWAVARISIDGKMEIEH